MPKSMLNSSAQRAKPLATCFCGRTITGEDADEGSIYCSSACARLDSMSALCAQESLESSTSGRMKQVFRIGRKEALAKSSHYRRVERYGHSGTSSSAVRSKEVIPEASHKALGQHALPSPVASTAAKNIAPTVAVARLQPAPKTLRPLLLASNAIVVKNSLEAKSSVPKLQNKEDTQYRIDDLDEDDASSYGDEADDEIFSLATSYKTKVNLGSHFSDSSFGSTALVSSGSHSTISSMSSLTPSSSVESLTMSASVSSLASSLRAEQTKKLKTTDASSAKLDAYNASRRPFSGAQDSLESTDNMATPKINQGFLRLDMEFNDSSWHFGSSESSLSDLLQDF